jgi:hypothetical protein
VSPRRAQSCPMPSTPAPRHVLRTDPGVIEALMDAARQADRLRLRDTVDPAYVLEEFALGAAAQRKTGCSRLLHLRNENYALVR